MLFYRLNRPFFLFIFRCRYSAQSLKYKAQALLDDVAVGFHYLFNKGRSLLINLL
jgi:hypothetical protein